MKRKYFLTITGLLMIILPILTACGNSPVGDPLDGTDWQLVFYRKTSVMEGTAITAHFENGEINGSAGCNSYFGAYQVEGENLSVGQIANTEMYCMEPEGLMEQETTYLEYLADAQSFEITDGRLIIYLSDHETLTFEPAE